jgi:hypothetical protein
MKTERQLERYLDAPATRRQTLNAIEQLIAAHEERHHTTAARRLLNRLTHSARKLGFRIREARNA